MSNTTDKIINQKDFHAELDFIEKINSLDQQTTVSINKETISAKLLNNENGFYVEIPARVIPDNFYISFMYENESYEIKKTGNSSKGAKHQVGKPSSFVSSYELVTFNLEKFSNKSTFKEFYQVDLKEIRTFHSEFETVTYQSNGIEKFYDCLRVNLNNVEYDIVQLKYNSKGFYIIECLTEQTFTEFSEASFSIRQAIGFINKLFVGGTKYTFDGSGKLHYSSYTRPTIKGMYNPIVTNPYSKLDIERSVADQHYEKLTRITLDNLSSFINKIHNNSEFSTAIMVILEATSTNSLLLTPTIFAVVIELLSKDLSMLETTSKKPIENKTLKKKIITELHKVIDENSQALDEESMTKIKRRLNEINKPINKQHLTNNEKLTRPFEQLGIELSLHDIEIIEHRNDLLHGNILLKDNDEQTTDEKLNLYMAYVSARLFTLISKLVLKNIGYKGYVYNQSQYLEKYIQKNKIGVYFEEI